jgi:2,3-bisphosphoglycerate-independent phosphoglycerate mutase
MKYVLIVGDGMSDHPQPQLNQRTPLQAADIPNLNFLARNGILGNTRTLL